MPSFFNIFLLLILLPLTGLSAKIQDAPIPQGASIKDFVAMELKIASGSADIAEGFRQSDALKRAMGSALQTLLTVYRLGPKNIRTSPLLFNLQNNHVEMRFKKFFTNGHLCYGAIGFRWENELPIYTLAPAASFDKLNQFTTGRGIISCVKGTEISFELDGLGNVIRETTPPSQDDLSRYIEM